MAELKTTTDLLLEWDERRPRTQQAEIGVSALGGCRRRAGYILAGHPREPGSTVQAVLGTAVHELVSRILREADGEYDFAPGTLTEQAVRFAGVLGHLDLYVPPVVRDIKTLGRVQQLDRIRVLGPPRQDLWQVSVYAAALVVAGHPVERVQLDYIARDSGDSWLFEEPFQVQHVRDAMGWLRNVRDTPLEWLSRDYRPDSEHCKRCPFRTPCWEGHADGRSPMSVLYRDDPDAATWALRLEDARLRRQQAEDDEKRARGALDAIRPNDTGTAEIAITTPGADDIAIRFTVSKGRMLPDVAQIRADYERGGGKMPVTYGEPHVRVTIVPRKTDSP